MLLTLAALAALALADEPEPAVPKFEATLRKSDDKFESSADKAGALWKITSKSGIGGATVSLKAGPAPKKVVIRFAGMPSLESFHVQDGALKLSGRLERQGKSEFYFDDKGKAGADPKSAAASLVVTKKGDDVEVVLTNKKPGKKWSLSWVDAYRR